MCRSDQFSRLNRRSMALKITPSIKPTQILRGKSANYLYIENAQISNAHLGNRSLVFVKTLARYLTFGWSGSLLRYRTRAYMEAAIRNSKPWIMSVCRLWHITASCSPAWSSVNISREPALWRHSVFGAERQVLAIGRTTVFYRLLTRSAVCRGVSK